MGKNSAMKIVVIKKAISHLYQTRKGPYPPREKTRVAYPNANHVLVRSKDVDVVV